MNEFRNKQEKRDKLCSFRKRIRDAGIYTSVSLFLFTKCKMQRMSLIYKVLLENDICMA